MEAEIDKKKEQIKKILRMRSSSTENYSNNYLYIFKKNSYKNSDLEYAYHLNLFGHNYTPKVASNMRKIAHVQDTENY